ncbi:MAG: hypothetical protein AUJ85_09765 [Elusimicrobia bacterium CG1_02_37_114]|nr:MAG: hypothetical protein AUJ85_09765 [Elusimicrobia bacterium CG1_02_37_114]PIV54053.1 MAG: hypothetical protein COS17_00490 [Elusimicrobia bacterium CG02_land_8_20_14_3_00_37_13]PIZ12697.1 MAG: hypothetical protein COY53_08690 [Elusimicrobia bacterium CG_4_10_14_0_8_um_filter_37_32]
MPEKTFVDIGGQQYPIESEIDPLQVQSIAKFVKEKLDEVRTNTGEASTSRMTVLACLNIAEELFRLRDEYEKFRTKVNRKSDELISDISSVLS